MRYLFIICLLICSIAYGDINKGSGNQTFGGTVQANGGVKVGSGVSQSILGNFKYWESWTPAITVTGTYIGGTPVVYNEVAQIVGKMGFFALYVGGSTSTSSSSGNIAASFSLPFDCSDRDGVNLNALSGSMRVIRGSDHASAQTIACYDNSGGDSSVYCHGNVTFSGSSSLSIFITGQCSVD